MKKDTAKEAVLGFDLGGTRIKMGLVERNGRVRGFRSVPTGSAGGRGHLLATLKQACVAAEAEAASLNLRLIGVGIGTAGFVDAAGRVAYATENLPGWTGTELRRELEASSGLPAAALNDVHAMALGEAWLGAPAALGLQDFVCVALGTGIGGCLIQGGAVFGGRDGHAGGFGHQIVMQEGGIPCGCGLSGCWESYASVNALKRLIAERMPEGFPADAARSGGTDAPAAGSGGAAAEGGDPGSPLTVDARPSAPAANLGGQADASDVFDPRRLFAAARAGQPAALAIVDEYASRVAVGLVNLVHTLNASDFVIGGAIAAQGEFLLSRIADRTERQIMPVYRGAGIRLHAASLGEQAGVVGAARALLRRI